MNPLRSPTLRLLGWVALVFVSLRPIAPVESAFAVAVLPARALAELAPSLAWLTPREVRAAEREVAERADAESAAGRALHKELVALAMPTEPELRARHLARGDVLRHLPGDRDRIEVKLYDVGGVRVGCPVVTGDAYVGRVAQVYRATCLAVVELVTARDAYVGARLEAARSAADVDVRMIVGGVDRRRAARGDRTHLVVHNPSQRRLVPGRVVVDELDVGLDPLGQLADGFVLGTVALGEDGHPFSDPALVAPAVDFQGGLFQVMVLLDPGALAAAGGGCFEDPLQDHRWIRVQALSSGEPTPGRAGIVLDRGDESGIAPGAALVSGARLLGRVGRAGPWRSDVRLLGDPGLVVTAAARVDGIEAPQILGELVSLGRGDDGALRLRWRAALPLAGAQGPVVHAMLYTGSGEAGLPPGLVLGRAELPTEGPSPRVVRLEPPVDPLHLRDLWVRVEGAPAAAEGSP